MKKRWMLSDGRGFWGVAPHPCPGPAGYEEKMNALSMYWDTAYKTFRRVNSPFAFLFETKLMMIDDIR